ncbi:MAG: redoxin domain-containing protein [Roseibacillus sp.]
MKTLILATCALASTAAMTLAYTPTPLEQGATAPDFALVNVDDKTLTLADVKGEKATAIIFTTNHCPDAIACIGRMKALVEQFESQGVGFAAINSNSPKGLRLDELRFTVYSDSFEDMKLVSAESEFNLPYLYDGETQEVAKAYGAVSTPHIFIFDADLKLKYNGRMDDGRRSLGPAKKNEARDALTAIVAGKEPAIIKTRPTGCTTKWLEKAGAVAESDKKWNAQPVDVETIDAATVGKLVSNEAKSTFRLLNVWSTSCGPCVAEFPDLAAIYKQYSLQNLEFITISLDPPKDIDKVTDFLKEHNVGTGSRTKQLLKKDSRNTNNYLFDGDTEDLAKALDPEWNGAMPHTLLIGNEGQVLYRHTGKIEPLALKKAIVAEVWRLEEE